uniref:BHLH domain-containing protein n=1 Tax=Romanomermis culicivorax TaxID=13658 RepID=A0A915JYL4_ROMCU
MKTICVKPSTSKMQTSTMFPKSLKTIEKSPMVVVKSPANLARLAVLKRRRRQEEFRRLKSILPRSILSNNYRRICRLTNSNKFSNDGRRIFENNYVDRKCGTAIEELLIIQSTVQYIDYLHYMISKRFQSGLLSTDWRQRQRQSVDSMTTRVSFLVPSMSAGFGDLDFELTPKMM